MLTFKRWLPAFGVLLSSSCLLVVDPEEYRNNASGGDRASTTTGPSGGAGAAPGSGGAGGAPICAGADLQTDNTNCGSCGFVCADEGCVAGVCPGSLTLKDGGPITAIAVADGVLFLAQRDLDDGTGGSGEGGAPVAAALDPGKIRTVRLDLASEPAPGLNHPVENVISALAVGTVGAKHVYFSGQNLGGALQTTMQACEATACVDIDLEALTVQVQSIVPVSATLYVALVGNVVVSLPIHTVTGEPALPEAALITSYEPAIPAEPLNAGLSTLAYTAVPEPALLTSSYDYMPQDAATGALYRAPISTLPLLGGGESAQQWGDAFTAQGFVVAADGTAFAHDAKEGQLLKIAGMPPTTTVFDGNAGATRAIDDDFVYLSSTGSPQVVRALALDGSGEVGASPAGQASAPSISAIDARHPKYVYYVRDNAVYRWPKPTR